MAKKAAATTSKSSKTSVKSSGPALAKAAKVSKPTASKAKPSTPADAATFILSQVPCFVHDLQLSSAKLFPAFGTTELKIAQTNGLPYFLGELPDPIFAAILTLCADSKISFKTVSPSLLAMSLSDSKYKPKFPVIAAPQDPKKTYFLPMAIEEGLVEGGGRFFSVGEDASTFIWDEKKAGAAKGKKAAVAKKAVAKGAKTVVKKKSVKPAKIPKAKKVATKKVVAKK